MSLYMFIHNLLNVLVQIANKTGLQKKMCIRWRGDVFTDPLLGNEMKLRFSQPQPQRLKGGFMK
jgi:hypothetical protein